MAHLYRVIYVANHPQHQQAVLVSATTEANAIAAAKAADSNFKQVITTTQQAQNIITGS